MPATALVYATLTLSLYGCPPAVFLPVAVTTGVAVAAVGALAVLYALSMPGWPHAEEKAGTPRVAGALTPTGRGRAGPAAASPRARPTEGETMEPPNGTASGRSIRRSITAAGALGLCAALPLLAFLFLLDAGQTQAARTAMEAASALLSAGFACSAYATVMVARLAWQQRGSATSA